MNQKIRNQINQVHMDLYMRIANVVDYLMYQKDEDFIEETLESKMEQMEKSFQDLKNTIKLRDFAAKQ
jgi:hypothetical protein